jgi:hypothetical protein
MPGFTMTSNATTIIDGLLRRPAKGFAAGAALPVMLRALRSVLQARPSDGSGAADRGGVVHEASSMKPRS